MGSGCTGAIAAQTLIEKGEKLTMLDVGCLPNEKASKIPEGNFEQLRRTDAKQHDYFLGEEADASINREIRTGAQLTPSRRYLIERVNELLPLTSATFFPMESLAYGGLGGGWGLGSCVFSSAELKKCGLNESEMNTAYQWVADRIGISGMADDVQPYTSAHLSGLQSPVVMDENGKTLFANYERKKAVLNKRGLFMGRPALALLTEDKGDRKAYRYRNLDFYEDGDQSAFRPAQMIEDLRKKGKLEYVARLQVIKFKDQGSRVIVEAKNVDSGENIFLSCDRLILATGTLGTARIVLNSSEGDAKLPLLCNPYSYFPTIQWKMLGKTLGDKPFGYAQLSLFLDKDGRNENVSMASIYSYQQLMLYRVIRNAPFDFNTNRKLFRYLLPALTIFGIHHPEEYHSENYFEKRGNDFHANYLVSRPPAAGRRQTEFKNAMRSLGCFVLKEINPGSGSSIHYAGTLPFSEKEKRFGISTKGRLNGTEHVYVADGSGFQFLPAKGLTLSLMANAHNVATNIFKN